MNIPNILSLFRLILVPVFAFVFFSGHPKAGLIAAVIFVVAYLTDIADGWIARRYNMVTKLGRILDPLADKLMKATSVVCLVIRGDIPLWVILVLVAKELIMMTGGLYLLKKTQDLPSSNWFGKTAEGAMAVLVLLLIVFPISRTAALTLCCVVLGLELLALCVYAVRTVNTLEKLKAEKKEKEPDDPQQN